MWGYVIDSTLSNEKNAKKISTLESLEFCRKQIKVDGRENPKDDVERKFHAESESEICFLRQAAAWKLQAVLDRLY